MPLFSCSIVLSKHAFASILSIPLSAAVLICMYLTDLVWAQNEF